MASDVADYVLGFETDSEKTNAQMGAKDLAPIFGPQGRVSEFLSGKRPLGKAQAVRLNRAYNVPLSLLLGVGEA